MLFLVSTPLIYYIETTKIVKILFSRPQNIAILGSTGSIGKNSLEVIASLPEHFKVTYLTANKNIDILLQQIQQFQPNGVVILDKNAAAECKKIVNGKTEILCGEDSLTEIVQRDNVDTVINSLVGFAGFKPTMKAIEARKKIALANKETLVVAGELIMQLLKKNKVTLLPIDSEHSAIFQCLLGENIEAIQKIILTASGGPFRLKTQAELKTVTVQQALNHPNWKMGNKITIDSATLMNKGLEVIEAHWLFNLPPKKIEVILHPQSIIHSMVEFVDGSVKAQLGIPDMKIPIQYALTYPERFPSNFPPLNFQQLKEMTFCEPNIKQFPCLQLAYDALSVGGTLPTVLNAANEIAVEKFLHKKISFIEIPQHIARAMDKHTPKFKPSLENIIETNRWAREITQKLS